MRFIDANIFIRALTDDHKAEMRACAALFQQIRAGSEVVITYPETVAEIVFVLTSKRQYGLPPVEVHRLLTPLLALPGVRLRHKKRYLRALELFAQYGSIDFPDIVCALRMQAGGIEYVWSYDQHFDRLLPGSRQEPSLIAEEGGALAA